MPRNERIVRCLVRFGKAGNASMLPQGGEAVAPPGDDLVCIALMPHIKNQAVFCSIVYPVNGNGQLHRAEIRGKVPAGMRDAFDLKTPQFLTQRMELRFVQFFDIFR